MVEYDGLVVGLIRSVISLGLAISVAGCGFGSSSSPSAVSNPQAATAWPNATLGAADAVKIDPQQFLSSGQLRDWEVDLDNRGLRATGTPAHESYIDELYTRLAAAGVKQLKFESVPLTRWSVDHWSLDILSGPAAGPVQTAAYIPYSGVTPAAGVSAPMVYLDANTTPSSSNVGGKIVLFDVPQATIFLAEFEAFAMGIYDPNHVILPTTQFSRMWLLSITATYLDQLHEAGAVGAIGILAAPYPRAHGIYVPYDRKLHSTPSLYVDQNVGSQMKQVADGVTNVRLVLPAEVKQVLTRNLIGIIPGASNELTVINSHTDGTNGIEDNGPNAIVAMSQYLSRLPQQALPRTIMILLSSGHFAGGVGAEGFLATHKDDGLLSRIASITTVEHLGAQEWLPDSNGLLAPTGKAELGGLFMPEIQALADASCAMLVNADASPGLVMKPTNASGDGTADNAVWPGEGQYFWGEGHIPTMNYITGPDYLINWGVTTADKVDFERMRHETIAFTQMLLDLSRVPALSLRTEGHVIPKPC